MSVTTQTIYVEINLIEKIPSNSEGKIGNKFGYKSSNFFNVENISDERNTVISHKGDYISNNGKKLVKFTINHSIPINYIENISSERLHDNIKRINEVILESHCNTL